MQSVENIARQIVAREGGYVDDPDDPGGATKFGVTLGTLRRLGLDLTGDGRIDRKDVQHVDEDRAVQLFIDHYFRAPGIDVLPGVLQPSVFDMYVNAGRNAVRILQDLLVEMGFPIAVDGVIGPKTAAAAKQASQPEPALLRDAYGVARRDYYFDLADRRPRSRKYVRTRAGGKGGWIKRAEDFLSPKYHLTSAEFQLRIAAWR